MIDQILTNQYFLLALTFGIYQGAKMLQRRTGSILLNPILIAIGLMIAFLTACDIPYDTYHESGQMIEFWLKPAVVALGVPLYLQLSQIKKQILPILASQMMGCIVGIISVVATARMLGASREVVASLASKSVTTSSDGTICSFMLRILSSVIMRLPPVSSLSSSRGRD